MKNHLLLAVSISICYFVYGQKPSRFSYDAKYYGQLIRKDKVLANIHMELVDSVYVIYYEGLDRKQKAVRKRYIGTFSITSSKVLILRGKHPFRGERFLIHDTIAPSVGYVEKAGYSESLYVNFSTRIKDSLSTKRGYKIEMISGRHRTIYTPENIWPDGCCLPDFFQPGFRVITKERPFMDSVFNKSFTESGSICSVIHNGMQEKTKFNYPGMHAFQADSIRFDTLYINKLAIENRNEYYVRREIICLKETLKLWPLTDRMAHMDMMEDTEIFSRPDFDSEISYKRSEVDECKLIRIIDYYKDGTGIEWIKVEIEMLVADAKIEVRTPGKFSGWMLQRGLLLF